MKLELIITNPLNKDSFIIKEYPKSRPENCWLQRANGEGTEVNKNELCHVIYSAINDYFNKVM